MKKWPEPRERETTFGGLSRSELMARVRSKGNKTTEQRLVVLFRSVGIKGWRRHVSLLGKPDFVWRKVKVAVFVDGCFWHGHDCGRNLTPKSNAEEWSDKISRNKIRDAEVIHQLRAKGWTVVRIWECELKKRPEISVAVVAEALNAAGKAIGADK